MGASLISHISFEVTGSTAKTMQVSCGSGGALSSLRAKPYTFYNRQPAGRVEFRRCGYFPVKTFSKCTWVCILLKKKHKMKGWPVSLNSGLHSSQFFTMGKKNVNLSSDYFINEGERNICWLQVRVLNISLSCPCSPPNSLTCFSSYFCDGWHN